MKWMRWSEWDGIGKSSLNKDRIWTDELKEMRWNGWYGTGKCGLHWNIWTERDQMERKREDLMK